MRELNGYIENQYLADQARQGRDALRDSSRSFGEVSPLYGTTPRNIIDKASEKPVNVQIANWTYRRRFEACREALKNEY